MKTDKEFEKAVAQAKANLADLRERGAEAMGEEYEIRIITEEEAEKERSLSPTPKKNPVPVFLLYFHIGYFFLVHIITHTL